MPACRFTSTCAFAPDELRIVPVETGRGELHLQGSGVLLRLEDSTLREMIRLPAMPDL